MRNAKDFQRREDSKSDTYDAFRFSNQFRPGMGPIRLGAHRRTRLPAGWNSEIQFRLCAPSDSAQKNELQCC